MSFNLGKSILGIATILVLISCSAQASLTDGLVVHYSFDDISGPVVVDESGNGNNATAYNDYEYVDGVFSDAIRLVGSGHTGLNGGHVLLPFIPLNEFPAFTISMWVNHEDSTSWGDESFITFGDYSQGDVIRIAYNSYFPNSDLVFKAGNGFVNVPYSSSLINNWNHLVLHCDNGILTGFINGQSVGNTTYELNDMRAIAGLGVHWFNSGGTESNRFIGMIDDVGIWTRALSEDEIQYIYLNPVPEPATILLLTFGGILLRRRSRS